MGTSSADSSGALIRVYPNGFRDVIASSGLTYPEGLAVGPDKAVYVSNCGTCAGKGEVIRIPVK